MSASGSGGAPKPRPARGGLAGRLGRRAPKPAAPPTPPARTGWKPKGSPQSPGSPGSPGTGGSPGNGRGAAGPERRTPPSRTGGSRTTRRPAGGPAGDGTARDGAGKSGERRFLPKQFLPGGAKGGDGAEGDAQGPQSGGGSGPTPMATSRNWTGGYTAVDYFMLFPGFAVAYFGGQLVQSCAVEAGGPAAIALWAMIGFWIVVGTARWPSFRVLRWAWVLAGVLGAVWTPG